MQDVAVTLGGQAAVALSAVVVYRTLAVRAGADDFASYALVKQAGTLVFPVLLLGLGVALPRYVALRTRPAGVPREAYLATAMVACGAAAAVLAIVVAAAPDAFGAVLFGSASRSDLVLPFAAIAAATLVIAIAQAWFRGLQDFRRAAAVQILAAGAVPVAVVLLLPGRSIPTLVAVMAAGQAAVALATILPGLLRGARAIARRSARAAGRRVLGFGVRRIPADLAHVGLFALAPLVLAHAGTFQDVAFLVAGQQVLVLVSYLVTPVGRIVLPSLAELWESDPARARARIAVLATLAVHLALFATPQLLIYGDVVVREWLGDSFEQSATIVRITVLPAGALIAYVALRSALDAITVKAYSSRNNVASLALFGVTAAALLAVDATSPGVSVACAFAVATIAQGTLALTTLSRLLALPWSDYRLPTVIALSGGLGIIGLAARPLVTDRSGGLLILCALQALLFAAYLRALTRSGVGWPAEIRRRLWRAERP